MEKFIKIFSILENKIFNKENKIPLIYNIKCKEYKDFIDYVNNKKYNVITMNYKDIDSVLNNNYKRNTIIISNQDYCKLDKFKDNYFMLDFYRITNNYNYLFLADFEEYDIKDFYLENKDIKYEGVKWNNYKHTHLNLGDNVFIYFYNVTDGVNRILLKTTAIDDGYHFGNDGNSLCLDSNNNMCIRLAFPTVFDDKNNKLKFGKKELENKYNVKINNFNSKQRISDEDNNNLVSKLNDFINDNKYSLRKFKDGFNKCCECKDLIDDNKHVTFEKENGLMHYEIHHLIEQNNLRKNENSIDSNIVYDYRNEINLCLNCHSRIHIGKIDMRKKMVKHIYNKRKNDIDELLDKIPESCYENIPSVCNRKLYWLLSQYVPTNTISDADLL